MKNGDKFSILAWCITFIGLILFFCFEREYYLILVSLGLGFIAFFEYKKLDKTRKIYYQDLKLVFIYIVGSIFSLLFFIMSYFRQP